MFKIEEVIKLLSVMFLVAIVTPVNGGGLGSLLKTGESIIGENTVGLNSDLLNSLTSQLGVTESQAAGGTGALLAMASQNLSDKDSSLLNSIIPAELSSPLTSQMFNQITDIAGVQQAFSALGLDVSMVQQFAPIIIQYLTANGGSSLVDSLTKIWS